MISVLKGYRWKYARSAIQKLHYLNPNSLQKLTLFYLSKRVFLGVTPICGFLDAAPFIFVVYLWLVNKRELCIVLTQAYVSLHPCFHYLGQLYEYNKAHTEYLPLGRQTFPPYTLHKTKKYNKLDSYLNDKYNSQWKNPSAIFSRYIYKVIIYIFYLMVCWC